MGLILGKAIDLVEQAGEHKGVAAQQVRGRAFSAAGLLSGPGQENKGVDRKMPIFRPRQNVEHYMRFKDQMKVAADGQKRLRVVGESSSD
ncbi:hypothetical protein JQ543_06750 [Bradyrhizobium diazoefficiens]|nr:hypothetical protein [Bradyrhizobium diazoefficiens]MBR0847433.1 hypothetical protein [Bradyrhizobium diazoefficiens]